MEIGFEYLRYGQRIALENMRSRRYIAYGDKGEATADGVHPGIYGKDFEPKEELIIRNFTERDSTDVVQSNRHVCLQTASGAYLVFNGAGELKVEANPNYDQNSNIARLAKWCVQDARGGKNPHPLHLNSLIAFKQAFNNYMVRLPSGVLAANAPSITEESSFKVVRADCPPLPEWYLHRRLLVAPEAPLPALMKKP